MQEVHISKAVKMIDSPGIIATPSNFPVSMALRSLQVEEKEESPLEAVRTLLKQCNQQQVRCQENLHTDSYNITVWLLHCSLENCSFIEIEASFLYNGCLCTSVFFFVVLVCFQ